MHVVAETNTVVGREAVVRTSMGDIRARLFADECPKVRLVFSSILLILDTVDSPG